MTRRFRSVVVASLVVLAAPVSCDRSDPPPPPPVTERLVPVGEDDTVSMPDSVEGDSVMARDTLWEPN